MGILFFNVCCKPIRIWCCAIHEMVSTCAERMQGVKAGGAFNSDKQTRKGVPLKGELGSVFFSDSYKHLD